MATMTLKEISESLKALSDEIERSIADSLKEVRSIAAMVDAMDRATDPHWLLFPLDHLVIVTGEFGTVYTVGGKTWQHEGLDLAVPVGTPVRACASGVVQFAGWRDGYGNCVTIEHDHCGEWWRTWYGHLSVIKAVSGAVIANQLVGLSGATGNVTGPHFHLTVQRASSTFLPVGCTEALRGVVNPRDFLAWPAG